MAKIPEIDEIEVISSYECYTETLAYIAHILQGWFLFLAKISNYKKKKKIPNRIWKTLGAIPTLGPKCPIDGKIDLTRHPKARFEI